MTDGLLGARRCSKRRGNFGGNLKLAAVILSPHPPFLLLPFAECPGWFVMHAVEVCSFEGSEHFIHLLLFFFMAPLRALPVFLPYLLP